MIRGLSLSAMACVFAVSANAMTPMNVPAPTNAAADQVLNVNQDTPNERKNLEEEGIAPETYETGRTAHFQETALDREEDFKCRDARDHHDPDDVMNFCNEKERVEYFQTNTAAADLELFGSDPKFLTQKASTGLDCEVHVDLSTQKLTYQWEGQTVSTAISSARSGYYTPTGRYPIIRFDKNHKSHKYNDSPMPGAMFFIGGWAIHGSYEGGFGAPHSHGCIRMPVKMAFQLYDRMKETDSPHFCISGTPPGGRSKNAKPVDDDENPVASNKKRKHRGDVDQAPPVAQQPPPQGGYYGQPDQYPNYQPAPRPYSPFNFFGD